MSLRQKKGQERTGQVSREILVLHIPRWWASAEKFLRNCDPNCWILANRFFAAKDFIDRILKKRPEERMSIEKALEHPVNAVYRIICCMTDPQSLCWLQWIKNNVESLMDPREKWLESDLLKRVSSLSISEGDTQRSGPETRDKQGQGVEAAHSVSESRHSAKVTEVRDRKSVV